MRCTKTVETCYFKEVKDAKRIVVFDKKPVVGKPLPMMMLMFVTDAFLTLEDLNRSPA